MSQSSSLGKIITDSPKKSFSVSTRPRPHSSHNLLEPFQSDCRENHSTEMVSNLLSTCDMDRISILSVLVLS